MEQQRSLEAVQGHPNKIGIKEGMGYMLGDAGNLFVLTYVSSFLKVFYTDVLKIAESKVASLFLVTRLWDAINDPMWGYIVARKKPNADGKFRPYLKWVSVPLGISAMLCFVDFSRFTSNQTLILLCAYVTYIMFGMLYTGMNIPFGSLASVITDDPEGRTLLSTFRSIGGGVGGAAPLLVAPLVIYKVTGTNAEGMAIKSADAGGMLTFGVIMGVLAIIFYMACFKTTRERVPSEQDPKVDMKKTYLGMLKSRPFVSAALAGILISGQLQFASLNQYLYKNYFENTNLSIVGTIANYLPMVILILFMPKLVKRFGKKELCGFGTFFSALASILMFFIVPKLDRITTGPAVFMLFLFIIGFGYSFVSITNWAVVADVIDYQEYKTGLRSESAIYAVYTFCRKLGQTAADSGGLLLLSRVAGYDGATMGSRGYIPGVGEGILFVCTLIPAIVYTLVFVLMQFAYPLDKKRLEPVYKYVREAHESSTEETKKA
ncbi:MAG: glycoside-pentoside-hexuronide (GPH):cation symporter [Clostridia bacterium]|nr:glycoside-pentoside-hexuronide (GPH):cation symporter [Clostridia bacterium]